MKMRRYEIITEHGEVIDNIFGTKKTVIKQIEWLKSLCLIYCDVYIKRGKRKI